jgi:hypothetical protein
MTPRILLTGALALVSVSTLAQKAPVPSVAATTPPAALVPAAETVVLSPFTVNTDKDNGFSATNAGTATKLGLDMKDMAAAYSVMTGEFLEALGLTNMQDAVLWSTNASPVIDGQGADQFNLPVMFNVRGAGQNVGQQRNFFTTASIGDTYNTERIDFGRGPNAVLFNTGASDVLGGGISSSTKRARFDRDSETVAFTSGSWDYYRTTLDVNRKLSDKLAVRANGVWQDRGGWMRGEFSKIKGLTVAGTYRLSPRTEFRVETENTKIRRTNPTFPPLDQVSGWDGATTFSAPITNAQLSSTVTPGATYGLTFNGEPQGIERYGIDYVYIPGSGSIQNWVNMARTRRADSTNRVPLYSGGQTWTRDGSTFLLPFGNASNQNNTPAIMDNGATNGPTILYSTWLPGDMFNRVIANSKFRMPDKRFTNMPDEPLFTQWTRDANIGFTHRFSDTLFFEFQADYNRVHNRVVNNINGFRTTVLDLNRNLPDGTPNPHFLDAYGQGQERIKDFYIDNGQARAVLNYIKDLGRWGNYTFNLSASTIVRKTDGRQAVGSVAIAADPREWQGQSISIRNYWNEPNRTFLPASGLPTTFFNRVVAPDGTTASTTTGTIQPHYVLNSWDDQKQKTNSGVFAMAGRWFGGKLVVTAGARDDSYRNVTRTGLRFGSLPAEATWDGYALDDRYWRAVAPQDWNELTYIPLSAYNAATPTVGTPTSKIPIPATTRPTITGANGVNFADPRYANVRFKDDYNNPDRSGHGLSTTYGLVDHLLPWVSAKLGYGTNYAIRGAATYDLYGIDAKPENGFGYDAGLTFTLFRDSALGGITIKPAYYFNRREYRLGVPPTSAPINSLMGRNDYTDGTANSRNQLGLTDVLGQDYFATLNTGYEIEFSGRVTRGWRLTGNLGTARAKDYDRWKNTQAYVLGRKDEFRKVLERAGGTLDLTQKNPAAGSAPGLAVANPALSDAAITAAGGSPTERANAVLDYNNIWLQFDSIPLIADTIGVKKLSWKILTDYSVQQGRLKGLRFGIGANFTDLNLAGYRSADTVANPNFNKALPVAANNLPYMDDPDVNLNTPIWFKQPFELTGTLGYSMRLRSGWRVLQGKEISFNFIVRNMMNWQKIIRQDTGLALRAPNGDLSLPYRVAVPSRVGSYQRPLNVEFTTTLRL